MALILSGNCCVLKVIFTEWIFLKEKFKIILIEPFELTNTARSVYDFYVFQNIISVFKKSHQIVKQKKRLEDLFFESFNDNK